MKKLGKLNINPEKVMKNEELMSLKGGTNCFCYDPMGCQVCSTGTASSASECAEMCAYACWAVDYSYTGY